MQQQACDVAIIGAGAAGLAASQRLAAGGRSVVVLEARDRIGGRIHTLADPLFPLAVELGAEFIHGRDTPTWEIVRAANRAAYLVDGEQRHFSNGHLRKVDDFWGEIDKVFERLNKLESKDMSFAEFAEKYVEERELQHAKQLALSFIEGFDAARADRISAQSIKHAEAEAGGEEPEGSESYRLIHGYASVIESLSITAQPDKVSHHLQTIVRSISWKRGDVAIESQSPDGTARPTIHCRAALITLPVSLLKARAVHFSPDLPEKFAAAEEIEMGAVVKVILRFREAFWESANVPTAGEKLPRMAFMHSRESAMPTWWTYFPVRASVLTGWAGGPAGERLSHRPTSEILSSALEALAKMTGLGKSKLEGLLQASHVADWQSDPFARGAYSYIAVGGMDAPRRLAAPVEDTLFFAGEATATEGLGGTVDAALLTGRRAADEILAAGGTL
jgi:monoamine oxidase